MALLCSVAVQVAPLRLCFYLLFYLLLISLFTHITSALITYDKGTLLDIGNRFTNLVQDTLSPNPSWPLEILRNAENKGHRRRNKKHRGNSTGIRNRLRKMAHSPPLPSIRLANVQSLENKMDDLRARISFQRDIRYRQFRYSERIESHFQLNDPRRMWQGLRSIVSFRNKSSAEVRADPLLADELTPSTAALNAMAAARQEAAGREERIMWSPCRRTRFEGPLREWTSGKWPDLTGLPDLSLGPALISLLVCSLLSLMSPLLPLWFPPPLKNPSSSLCLRTINPLAWMTIVQWPSHQ